MDHGPVVAKWTLPKSVEMTLQSIPTVVIPFHQRYTGASPSIKTRAQERPESSPYVVKTYLQASTRMGLSGVRRIYLPGLMTEFGRRYQLDLDPRGEETCTREEATRMTGTMDNCGFCLYGKENVLTSPRGLQIFGLRLGYIILRLISHFT